MTITIERPAQRSVGWIVLAAVIAAVALYLNALDRPARTLAASTPAVSGASSVTDSWETVGYRPDATGRGGRPGAEQAGRGTAVQPASNESVDLLDGEPTNAVTGQRLQSSQDGFLPPAALPGDPHRSPQVR